MSFHKDDQSCLDGVLIRLIGTRRAVETHVVDPRVGVGGCDAPTCL